MTPTRRLLLACLLLPSSLAVAAEVPPRVFLSDGQSLLGVKRRVAAGDERLAPAMALLRRGARVSLAAGPFSVTDKETLPPSGDKHDYMSVGPYWWPDPTKPNGEPYMRRDGRVNPSRNHYDNVPMTGMQKAVSTLALAYYLSGHEPYADHAAMLLKTWFLDERTRMNPNLNYGQAIPGRCQGRGVGIIDTMRLVRVVDAVGMLEGARAFSEADRKALQAWFREYLTWLRESEHGRSEARAANNHGTWYDVQTASFALFVGDDKLAREILARAATRRIATQIEPDGRQPLELHRSKSFSYSVMNLLGLVALAELARNTDVDLWHFESDDGRSIRKALDWLIPYALGRERWTHKQITRLPVEGMVSPLRRAAIAYKEPRYERMILDLPGVDATADRTNLLYPKME